MSQILLNQPQQEIISFAPTEPSVENFLTAVQILFHSKNQQQRQEANKYLIQFDKFQESWDISLRILSMPNLSDEAYFNIIQVLKKKIQYDFGNYFENKDIIQKLIGFLLENIEVFNAKKNYILSNYCHCFALALVFTGESFSDIMKEIVKKLNNDNIANIMSLLMLFNNLGEVSFDNQIVLDDQNKDLFLRNLEMIEKDVIIFINYIILKYSKENKEQMIKSKPELAALFNVLNLNLFETITVWIQFGLYQDTLISLKKENIAILDFIFKIDQNLLSNQTICICELLKCPMEGQLNELGNVILTKILPFKDIFYQSIDNMDENEAGFFVDIFTTLVTNNFSDVYCNQRYDLIQIVIDLIPKCPSNKIDLICQFWEAFTQFLATSQIAPDVILGKFGGLFKQMFFNCINLLQFDSNTFRELNIKKSKHCNNNDNHTHVKEYRDDIRKLFKNFVREYSFELVYNDLLYEAITTSVQNIKQNSVDMNRWARLEALLFAFSTICREVKRVNDISFLPQLFAIIFEIPASFCQITRTVNLIIDELGIVLSKK